MTYQRGNPVSAGDGTLQVHGSLTVGFAPNMDTGNVTAGSRFAEGNKLRVSWVFLDDILDPSHMVIVGMIRVEPSGIGGINSFPLLVIAKTDIVCTTYPHRLRQEIPG